MTSSQTFEKLVGPFITLLVFVAGYFFSRLDHIRERKRSARNIKQMLFEELKANYQKFARTLPSGEKELGDFSLPMFFASISEFDFQVYDAYLNRMDILKPAEVQTIYDAYRFMRKTKDSVGDLLNMLVRSEQDPQRQLAIVVGSQPVLEMVRGSLKALSGAISLFPGGPKFLNEQETSEKIRPLSNVERDMDALVSYFKLPVSTKNSVA